MMMQQDVESIKMGLDLASTQQSEVHQYEILLVVRDEVEKLMDKVVRELVSIED